MHFFQKLKERTVANEVILAGSLALSNITSPNQSTLYGGDLIATIKVLKHLVVDRNESRLSNFSEQEIAKLTLVSI